MAANRLWVIVLVVVIVVAGAAAVVWEHVQQQPAPATPAPGVASVQPTPAAPAAPASPAPTSAAAKPSAPVEPLPPLLPGSPLTDEKFATISAKIVIAALGLKQDKEWELNTLLYMSKVLDQAGIDEKQFKDYAQALTRHPDRARAVSENIMSKAEKKLGYRVTMDKMPMFNLSPERVKKIDKQLQQKLK